MSVAMPDVSGYYTKPRSDATKDFLMQQTVRATPIRTGPAAPCMTMLNRSVPIASFLHASPRLGVGGSLLLSP